MKKIFLSLILSIILALPAMAADYTVSVTQIVEHPSLNAMQDGFKDRLNENGLDVEYNVHYAQGDSAINGQIASQILGEAPDLVLAIATPSAVAAAQKIKEIPIVFTGVTDPVDAKIVDSLEKPGHNVTGMTDMSPIDLQLELIIEFLPDMKSLGVIYNAGEPNSVVLVNWLNEECEKHGIKLREATVDNSSGVYQAAKSLVGKVDAIFVPVDNTVVSALEAAIKVCTQNKLPLFTADTDSVARGSVAAKAVDYYKMGLQTGDMGTRILRDGAIPAEMPVESLLDYTIHVNKKAAADMGIEIPDSVLSRAENVIE